MKPSKINKYIDDHASEMINCLSSLVSIPSVKAAPEENMPYGKEPARALAKMLDMAKNYGFSVTNHENYVGTIDMDPAKENQLGVLCHLDVVPEGTGWKYPPYTLTLSGGKLYGRGTSDDKGPAVAVLFAMRALKECGFALSKNVRLIVGTDEECGSSDLAYYRAKEALPPYVFTPDATYPVINLEKGRMSGRFVRTVVGGGDKTVVSVHGGVAFNAVPEKASAVVKGFSEAEINEARKYLPEHVTMDLVAENELTTLTVNGKAAHASTPEVGKNAVTALLRVLGALETTDGTAEFFASLSKIFVYGECDGSALGIRAGDEKSGDLTFVFSMIDYENGAFSGAFDIRFPICESVASVRAKLEKAIAACGLSICDFKGVEPHYVDENSDFIQTLLQVYSEFTGNEGHCLAIGGGTYVHGIEGGVAFGAEVLGEDNHVHGADEFISLNQFLLNAKIFAEAILRICQ
ncbi:MAG: dipeptidase PepV [Clostridia bacterium]|nr:dipeptidase PepV [Clostridia bacterium]